MASKFTSYPEEIGTFNPQRIKIPELATGEVGYIATGLKDIHAVKVGDTVCFDGETAEPLQGYKEVKPFVFVSIYPVENDKFPQLREALEKLSLSDSSLAFEPENNTALGFGFRCGFLGLLHMDIIKERLQREFGLNLIITAPNVRYRIKCIDGSKPVAGAKGDDAIMDIENPSKFPEKQYIEKIYEPYILSTLVLPAQYVGNVMALCENKRGDFLDMTYITEDKVKLTYEMPLADSIVDFYDNLKSVSSGYASFDYELSDYKESDLVKLDILVNNESVDALSFVVFRNNAEYYGRKIVEKLRGLIPRQMFEVPIQASIGGRIIARENVRALRKDVIAKCYGGDISRKSKSLGKQKEGKKKNKQFGKPRINLCRK